MCIHPSKELYKNSIEGTHHFVIQKFSVNREHSPHSTQGHWCTSHGQEETGKEKCCGFRLHDRFGIGPGERRLPRMVAMPTPRKCGWLSRSGQNTLIACTNTGLLRGPPCTEARIGSQSGFPGNDSTGAPNCREMGKAEQSSGRHRRLQNVLNNKPGLFGLCS